MRILLIGELFSDNLGDQLVYESTKYLLNQIHPNTEFLTLDIMGRSASLSNCNQSQKHTLKYKCKVFLRDVLRKKPIIDNRISRFSAKRLINYYKETIFMHNIDLAVFTGGQLIKDVFVEYIYMICNLLKSREIPYVFNAVGLGVVSDISVSRYKEIFETNYLKGISCRSDGKTFNELLFPSHSLAIETFDTAICVSEIYPIVRTNSEVIVGLGIMNTSRIPQNELIGFWKKIVVLLQKSRIKWKMFSTGCQEDYLLAKNILEQLQLIEEGDFSNYLLDRPTSTKELVNDINQFDSIVSFRLHSHIIAASYGIPSFAIYWDNKQVDFFHKIGRDQFVYKIDCKIDNIVSEIQKSIANDNRESNAERINEWIGCAKTVLSQII